MPVVHILKAHAKSSTATVEFPYHNDALAYARKMAPKSPCKPMRRVVSRDGKTLVVWTVAVAVVRTDRAQYERFAEVPGYLGWNLVSRGIPC